MRHKNSLKVSHTHVLVYTTTRGYPNWMWEGLTGEGVATEPRSYCLPSRLQRCWANLSLESTVCRTDLAGRTASLCMASYRHRQGSTSDNPQSPLHQVVHKHPQLTYSEVSNIHSSSMHMLSSGSTCIVHIQLTHALLKHAPKSDGVWVLP